MAFPDKAVYAVFTDTKEDVAPTDHVDDATRTAQIIDHNHLLFMHPSDTPDTSLISEKLIRTKSYNFWSRSMHISLVAKNKHGFIDGSCCKEDYDPNLHQI